MKKGRIFSRSSCHLCTVDLNSQVCLRLPRDRAVIFLYCQQHCFENLDVFVAIYVSTYVLFYIYVDRLQNFKNISVRLFRTLIILQ